MSERNETTDPQAASLADAFEATTQDYGDVWERYTALCAALDRLEQAMRQELWSVRYYADELAAIRKEHQP